MPDNTTVTLLVENRAEELMANGIFADLVRDELIRIRMCWESSSIISIAEYSLLKNPHQPVAIILNGGETPSEKRDPIVRIFARAAPQGPWHVAMAIPDMTAWLRLDPQFSEVLAKKLRDPSPSKIDIAVFFNDWCNAHGSYQFDRGYVSAKDHEFGALHEFMNQQLAAISGSA